jgi:hypothetical protein
MKKRKIIVKEQRDDENIKVPSHNKQRNKRTNTHKTLLENRAQHKSMG